MEKNLQMRPFVAMFGDAVPRSTLELTYSGVTMLRASSKQAIIEKLENSYFGLSNFSVDFAEGNPRIVTIKFIPNSQFTFALNKGSGPWKFQSIEAPGVKFLAAEYFNLDELNFASQRLENWLSRVREELVSSNPFARELSELRSILEAQIEQMGTDQEDFFSAADAAVLSEKLDQLAAKVAELTSRTEGAEESIASLTKTINDLKDAATLVNRGTWYRMSSGRLVAGLKSLATSKEAREFALEAAKKFLLEGPK